MSDDDDDDKIIRLNPDTPRGERTYERTIIDNRRRYRVDQCPHKGPFIINSKLATVECEDCGALLNPMYVLECLANRETYWNMRRRDLSKYLKEIDAEIQERSRTKCTHCGNMTAIRFKGKMPRTWVPEPY